MTEQEYVELIKSRWPSDDGVGPAPDAVAICDQAVVEFPSSAKLWLMRGDLIQRADYEDPPLLSEAERSYRQVIAVCPSCAEAYDELSHFLDSVMAKPRKARQYFRKAWLLRRAALQKLAQADALTRVAELKHQRP